MYGYHVIVVGHGSRCDLTEFLHVAADTKQQTEMHAQR